MYRSYTYTCRKQGGGHASLLAMTACDPPKFAERK